MAGITIQLPECGHNHEDCFGRVVRGDKILCKCLINTFFGKRDCPFYKPDEQVNREWAAALKRREERDGRRKHDE